MPVEDTHLRARLRQDTYPAHERLDAQVSGFRLDRPEGLRAFLILQNTALCRIAPVAGGTLCAPMIADLQERLATDLAGLGAADRGPGPALDFTPEPVAIDYVIGGSRLGTMVLRKRWLASSEVDVREAQAYFSAPPYSGVWQQIVERAKAMDASGAAADRIVADANRLFAFYGDCAGYARASLGAAED